MSHVIENDFLEIVRFLFYCIYRARKRMNIMEGRHKNERNYYIWFSLWNNKTIC